MQSTRNIIWQLQILFEIVKLVQFFLMGFKKVYTFYKWNISKKLINIFLYKVTANSCNFWPIFVYHDQSIQVYEPKFTTMQTSQNSNHTFY
jgi:hypothetical protein